MEKLKKSLSNLYNPITDSGKAPPVEVKPLSPTLPKPKPTLVETLEKSIKTIDELILVHGLIIKNHSINGNEDAIMTFYKSEKMITEMQVQYKVILEGLKSQRGDMKQFLVEHTHLEKHLENILKGEAVNRFTVEVAVDFLFENILMELSKLTKKLEENLNTNKREIPPKVVSKVKIICGKMEATLEYLPKSATFDVNDLFSKTNDHSDWKKLKAVAETKVVAPPEKIKKSFSRFVRMVWIAQAVGATEYKGDKTLADIQRGLGAVYYTAFQKEAETKANLFYSQASQQGKNPFEVWHMLENPYLHNVMKVTFDKVNLSRMLYLPRMFPPITEEWILQEMKAGTLNTFDDVPLNMELQDPKTCGERLRQRIFYKAELKGGIPVRLLFNGDLPITLPLNTDDKVEQISSEISNKVNAGLDSFKDSLKSKIPQLGNFLGSKPKAAPITKVIIHIHGGGFVSMSSASHQIYTRKWANLVGVPVFSIDYRLAPEFKYPAGLDDCWQVYNLIINYVEETLGIKPEKIVLVGDSAGGNLCMALTLMAIKRQVRIPDGVLLAYPALDLSTQKFTPSLLHAINDQILPYSLLKLCVAAYVPAGCDPEKDPFLSPMLCSEEFVNLLPPIKMVVGTEDSLHDGCWRFAQRLHANDKDVKLTVYEGLPHGFLNYDKVDGVDVTLQETANMLRELLGL
jgi:hormone-sensitive lipase